MKLSRRAPEQFLVAGAIVLTITAAVGVYRLPLNFAVEVDAVVEVR